MSGYKHATVTISQEEYRRLNEADMTKRFKTIREPGPAAAAQSEVVRALVVQLEERERQIQRMLASAGQESAQADLPIMQDLLNQNALHCQQLTGCLLALADGTEAAADNLRSDLLQQVQAERDLVNQNLRWLMREQDAFRNRDESKQTAAEQWFEGCLALGELLRQQFDHERFAPGRIRSLLRNLELAESNLSNGFYESSLQGAQQLYLQLCDLNFELEQATIQWQSLFATTFSSIDELVAQMTANQTVSGLGLDGEPLADQVDLNFWTNGRFSQLLQHVRQLAANVLGDQDLLTLPDLERIHSQILPVVRAAFESIIFDARFNALNSQLRMNIAETALLALENHGFALDSSGYCQGDMRGEFFAHLASPDGTEVTLNVVPSEEPLQSLSSELVMVTSHPDLKSEHEARLRWAEISETLSRYDLEVNASDSDEEGRSSLAIPVRGSTQYRYGHSEAEK